MSTKPRSSNYSPAEDVILAEAWLDIHQDPIVGRSQPLARFWQRVCDKYNTDKPSSKPSRNLRSVQTRASLMLKDCRKFNGCMRQVELMHISGANDQILLQRAHQAYINDTGSEDGFKFVHVWNTIKDYLSIQEEIQTSANGNSSNVEENFTDSPSSNPSLSSFTINLSDENNSSGSSPPRRPEGGKKSKLKRKQGEDMSTILQTIKEGNEKFREMMENSYENRDRAIEIQSKKVEALEVKNQLKKQSLQFQQQMRDDNVLNMNPDSIEDPERRMALKLEQQQIIRKRREAYMATSNNTGFGMFGEFPDIGGSGTGLSDY